MVRLRIVGTATLSTIGASGDPALEIGTGAVMAPSLFSAADLNEQGARSRALWRCSSPSGPA
jgi:hypothetical protein